MLTSYDFKIIEKELSTLKPNILSLENKIKIKELDFSNVEEKDMRFGYIDSSYIYGVIGPIVYIYSRVCGIGKTIYEDREFIILQDHFIQTESGYLDVQDVAELISKNLEYRIATKLSEETDYIIVDGSLYADLIVFSKTYNFQIQKLKKIEDELKINLFKLLDFPLISIAKRIVQARFFDKEESDIIYLIKNIPEKEFYTDIGQKSLEEFATSLLKPKIPYLKFIYFRPRINDHIYRLEALPNISDEELRTIVFNLIKRKQRYPKMLRLAHNRCKIRNSEKNAIEAYIKKVLGYKISTRWETR